MHDDGGVGHGGAGVVGDGAVNVAVAGGLGRDGAACEDEEESGCRKGEQALTCG